MILLKNVIKYFFNLIKRVLYPCLKPFYSEKVNIDSTTARNILESVSPSPKGKIDASNTIQKSYDLMIIVPAYNSEDYIEKCLESIISQETKYTYEVVVVNDGSTDDTVQKIKKYEKNENVRVINQSNNGVAAARNRALEIITGNYIMFVDSDDYLMPGAIEKLMDMAVKQNAEIVEGGAHSFYNSSGTINRYFSHNEDGVKINPMKSLTGYPWGKVFKSEIFEKIKFPEGYWYEDTLLIMIIYCNIKNAYVINDDIYAYRVNPSGATQSTCSSNHCVDTFWITELLVKEQHKRKFISQDCYEQFFCQMRINYMRMRKQPKEVIQSLFVLSRECYDKYISHYGKHPSTKRQKELVRAMEQNDWKRASLILEYWEQI